MHIVEFKKFNINCVHVTLLSSFLFVKAWINGTKHLQNQDFQLIRVLHHDCIRYWKCTVVILLTLTQKNLCQRDKLPITSNLQELQENVHTLYNML